MVNTKRFGFVFLTAVLGFLAACTPSGSGTVGLVSVSPRTADIGVGQTQQLTATVLTTGSAAKTVQWSSSNPSVASVNASGLVTGLSSGEAVITATSTADATKKSSAGIRVLAAVEEVIIDPGSALLATQGRTTQQFTATVSGSPSVSQEVDWSIDNPSVATVSNSGLVTAVGPGFTTLTATSRADTSKFGTATIQVAGQLTLGNYPALVATANRPITSANPSVVGGDGNYTYSITPALPTGLTLNSAGVITGTPTAAQAATTYTVRVADSLGSNDTGTISITINAAPTIAYTASNALSPGVAANITPTVSGGTAPFTYTLNFVAPTTALPAGLTFSTTTGAITGTPTTVTTTPATFTVTLTDANTAAVTSNSFSISVVSGMTASYTVNRALTVGQAIVEGATGNYTRSVTGNTGTLSYAVVSGALPAGLSLATNGAITGTPAAAITSASATIRVTDTGSGAIINAPITLSVNAAPSFGATSYNSGSIALTAGRPVTGTPGPVTTGGTPTLSYSISPTLPTGLAFSTTTGVISGTSAVAVTSATYTVTVTDANTATATRTLTLVVNPTVSATSGYASTFAIAGSSFTSAAPGVGGGTAPIRFRLPASTTLPAGLSLNATTGVISGTPSTGSPVTSYTIEAYDTNGSVASLSFTMAVNLRVAYSSTTYAVASNASAGTAVASAPTVTGATGARTFSSTSTYSGSGPGNPDFENQFNLDPTTGAITTRVNPTAGIYTVTIQVTDSSEAVGPQVITITVSP